MKPKLSEDAEMRVRIAKDAMAGVECGALTATNGTYFHADVGDGECQVEFEAMPETAKLSDVMGTFKECRVCALGAAFAATVTRVKPNITLNTYGLGKSHDQVSMNDTPMRELLRKYFSSEQIGLMETAFEGTQTFLEREMHLVESRGGEYGGDGNNLSPSARVLANKAAKWRADMPDPRTRLLAMFQNVIDNGGTFVP